MKIENESSIIDSKNIILVSGYLPYRYVLRYVPDSFHQYVTHREVMKLEGDTFIHDSFECGHYFNSIDSTKADLEMRT
jgi:hypothetical protein